MDWQPLAIFAAGIDDNVDDAPRARAQKLGKERQGHLIVEHAYPAWSGGLALNVSDGRNTVDVMLDAAQVEFLKERLDAWEAGQVLDDNNRPLRRITPTFHAEFWGQIAPSFFPAGTDAGPAPDGH